MKCTSKIFLERFNEMPSLGVGVHLPWHVTSLTIYSKHSQTKKMCKKYQYEERYQPPKFQMCIEIIGIICTPPPKDQALVQVEM